MIMEALTNTIVAQPETLKHRDAFEKVKEVKKRRKNYA